MSSARGIENIQNVVLGRRKNDWNLKQFVTSLKKFLTVFSKVVVIGAVLICRKA